MKRNELLEIAKPILFNTDMVRAILDGRKTVTRRIIKPQPKTILCYAFAGHGCGKWMYPDKDAYKYWEDKYKRTTDLTSEDEKRMWTPPCHTDDILYVRETWGEGYEEGTYIYKANDKLANLPEFKESSKLIYHPSIHMPKEAARIFLKVTNVRVEQLQDITDEQAKEEGSNWRNGKNVGFEEKMRRSAVERFAEIWNSTIKKSDLKRYGWEANPWVWVIEFERVVEE